MKDKIIEEATEKAVTEFCNAAFKKYEPVIDRMVKRVEVWFDEIMDEIEKEKKEKEKKEEGS